MPTAKELRWGIVGSGKICNDFANALRAVGYQITAVAASRSQAAATFATQFGIPTSYGSYAELAADTDVDVVYIGTIHPMHKEQTLLFLNAGKHVLVEKPIALNAADAAEMVACARAKNLFLMEGMWTRCFPATKKVQEEIDGGSIGKVTQAWGDFGFFGTADLTSYPPEIARLFDLKLGGGALLDIGIYPLAAVAVGFGRKAPTKVTATGILHTTGADVQGSVALKFGAAETATVNYTIRGETPETVTFIGTKGQIEICTPAHAPTAVKITKATAHGTTATQTFHFPLPATAPGLPPLVFPNSQGFQYEAMAVADAISKGLTEAPEWTLDETMDMMNELDEIRRQLGVVYPAVTAATAPAAPAASPTSGRPTSPLGLQGQQTIAHGFYALFDSHYRRRSIHRGNEEVGANRPLSPLEFAPTAEPDMHVDLIGNFRRPLRAAVTSPYHHVPDTLEQRPATAKPNWYGDNGTRTAATDNAATRPTTAKPNWWG